MENAKCKHTLGCHGCLVDISADWLWEIRQELKHIMMLPQINQEQVRELGHKFINRIDAVIIGDFKERNDN
jgi:hypothetical protein